MHFRKKQYSQLISKSKKKEKTKKKKLKSKSIYLNKENITEDGKSNAEKGVISKLNSCFSLCKNRHNPTWKMSSMVSNSYKIVNFIDK